MNSYSISSSFSEIKPGRQARSLETERRLIAAVLTLLDEGGLEACTAPALAARAGVAVGTIYARYPDKDALIAAALLHMVRLGDGAQPIEDMARAAADLEGFLTEVVRTTLDVVRTRRRFLLAVREFVRRSGDAAWRGEFHRAQGLARERLQAAAIARFGGEVRGGVAALSMALVAIYGAVEVAWLDPETAPFADPPSPEEFTAALVEMQVRYLT